MAVLDEEIDPVTGQPVAGQNQPGGSGGFIGGSGGQGATTTKATPAPTSSGNFTNLQSYLDANKSAAANMGQGIAGTINQAGQTADKAISDYGKVGTGGAANAESANDKLQGVLGNANGGMSGIMSLLDQTYKQPGYTSGERGLDSALINGTGAKDAITGAANAWSGEGQKLTDTATAIGERERNKVTAGTGAPGLSPDQSYQQQATSGSAKPYQQMAGAGPTTTAKVGSGVTWLTPGQLQSGFTNAPLPNAIDYGNRQPEFASFTPEQYAAFANAAKATQASNTSPPPSTAPGTPVTSVTAPSANAAGVSGVDSGSSGGASPYGGILGYLGGGGSPTTGVSPSNVASGAQQAGATAGQVATALTKRPTLR